MIKKNASVLKTVTILGSLPPLRALSSYCLAFSLAVSRLIKLEFISFKRIYPSFMYPGGGLKEDYTFPRLKETPNLKIRRKITWYNPLTWIIEGIFTKGQLLHAQWWSPPLIIIYLFICLIYRIRRKPVVITVHNIIQHEEKLSFHFFSRILFMLGDHFIVHSKSNRDFLIKLYQIDDDKVTQIPHGPLDFCLNSHDDSSDAREIIGLKPQDRVLLFFGAIRPYKGLNIILDALAEIVKEVPEVRLVIAGRLWESWDRYEKIIREKKISAFIQKYLLYIDTDEVAKYFLASDLVILPYINFSSQSGVGTTAVAFRKPMIVSRTGGLPELVVDQKNVITPGDAEALSDRIIYCLKNPEALKKMSEEAGTIAKNLSWESIAQKTISVYEKVLNREMSR